MADVSKDERRVEIPIGDGSPHDWAHLSFDIVKVHANQKPTDDPSRHAQGGDWTFLDCRTNGPRPANFTVGVRTKPGDAAGAAWGEATILVADRREGATLLDDLATSFAQQLPPEVKPQPLEPWKFNTVVLGDGLKPDPAGGFRGLGGNWTATKWFLERDGLEAEVFFNYSLKDLKGEFGEKDMDYREDLVAILATVLRDGPRPERTPETDSNLTLTGPKFGEGRLVAKEARHYQFDTAGKQILFATKADNGPTSVLVGSPERPDRLVDVAQFQGDLEAMQAADADANQILIVEVLRKEKGSISTEDPRRLWWVVRRSNETRELKGPWEGMSFYLAEKPVSPDLRYIAMTGWRARTAGTRDKQAVIYILNRQTGTTRTIAMGDDSPYPMGWIGAGNNLRLAFVKNRRWDKSQADEWCLAEPETGTFSAVAKSPMPSDESVRQLSPDGKLIASIAGKEELTINEKASGHTRTFLFHQDDRRFVSDDCFQWVSPRYLLLRLNRLAFFDVLTMKMSYPIPKNDESAMHTFSSDFQWVLWQKPEDGLYVSPVLVPSADL